MSLDHHVMRHIHIQSRRTGKVVNIVLNRLANVNYLVGENGCGKTRVLEFIHKNREDSWLIRDSITISDVIKMKRTKPDIRQTMKEKRLIVLDYVVNLTSKSNQSQLQEIKIILSELELNSIQSIIDTEALNGGVRKIEHLVQAILEAAFTFQARVFLIEEPETHLHPRLQKKLAQVFDLLAKRLNIQLFIATHSPFVVSTSGEITDQEKLSATHTGEDFLPSQKVYFLIAGQVASRGGEIGLDERGIVRGSFGYWGSKSNFLAGKMLGAGLEDFLSPQEAYTSSDAPIIIFCEGQGAKEDAKIYNQIFREHQPPVLFVSARGSSQLYKTYELVNEIKTGLSANVLIWMLRDRDHEFANIREIDEYKKIHLGSKVLFKRALECYLYSSEIARILLKEQRLELSDDDQLQLDRVQEEVQQEAEQGIQGNDYKYRLRETFKQAIHGYRFSKKDVLEEKVASLITPLTKTYWELRRSIF